MSKENHIGIVLPHFGDVADPGRILEMAARLEDAGVDSVWFRDHLSFAPHDYEPPGTRFLDPFTSLAAIAATTRTIGLGTATLIPIRHPLIVSQLLGGIDALGGGGRLIVGVGAGGVREPFEALGLDFSGRFKVIDDWVGALTETWKGAPATWAGEHFAYDSVTIDPRPSFSTPVWYGGASASSVRRACRLADGWLPGRCPLSALTRLVALIRTEEQTVGKRMTVGVMPLLAMGDRRDQVLEGLDLDPLLRMARANPRWTGEFNGPEDLDGLLIAGNADDCVSQAAKVRSAGVDALVFDLRLVIDQVDEQFERFVTELVPALRTLD